MSVSPGLKANQRLSSQHQRVIRVGRRPIEESSAGFNQSGMLGSHLSSITERSDEAKRL